MIAKKSWLVGLALVGGLGGVQSVLAAAGNIVLATGQVFIADAAGARRPATVGMNVETGETLVTQDGRAQIKFTDGSLISLQPASELKVTDYKFKEPGKGADSAVFNFIKGGLRAVSGLIGGTDRQAYRMDSVVATIGIRGTEYKAILCDHNCKEPDGLYVQTGEGIVVVKNAFGEVEVSRGQTAYVPSPNEAPRKSSQAPTVTAQPTVVTPTPIAGIGAGTEFQPGTIMTSNNIGEVTAMTSGGIGLAASGTGTASSLHHGSWNLTGATSYADGDLTLGGPPGSQSGQDFQSGGVYLVDNQLRGGIMKLKNGEFGSIVLGKPTESGHDGNLYWGRWTNPQMSIYAALSGFVSPETITTNGLNLHYILGTSMPTIPTAGVATYSFLGGTASTDSAGGIGSGITSGTLTANFLSNYVSANFAVNHGGNYNVSASMAMGSDRTGFTGVGTANGSTTANVSGFFAGTNAPTAPSHAGVSYDIQTAKPIAGVGAFRCSSGC